jgi:hypothetical protein
LVISSTATIIVASPISIPKYIQVVLAAVAKA